MRLFCLVLLFVVKLFGFISANNNIVFIFDHNNRKCVTIPSELQVYKGDAITLHVYWFDHFFSYNVRCLLNRKAVNIKQYDSSGNIKTTNFTISNASEDPGPLQCIFSSKQGMDFYVHCNMAVNVKADNVNLYIICGVIGTVLVIIIITLSVIICRLKSKRSSRLERSPKQKCDYTVRYSTMPGERRISKKREGSCIYESMENINNEDSKSLTMKERGRHPLPGQEHTYDGGVTQNTLFSAIPAKLDTKPKVPPVEELEYENPEVVNIKWPKTKDASKKINHQNMNPLPVAPKPEKKLKLPQTASTMNQSPSSTMQGPNPLMMRELGSLLKQKSGAPIGSHGPPSPHGPPAPHNLRQNQPPATKPKPDHPSMQRPAHDMRPQGLQVTSPGPERVPLGFRPPLPHPVDHNPVSASHSLRRPGYPGDVQQSSTPKPARLAPAPPPPETEMDSTYDSENSDPDDWEYETLPNYSNYQNIPM